jgi:hypothetical protein
MREFKFFRGFSQPTITERLEQLLQEYPPITDVPTLPMWTRTTNDPIWQVNPGLIQYTPPNYTHYIPPSYQITTTPGTGTFTIPANGTITTSNGFSLTTSNTNGVTYTTGGFGGTLTTGTATFYNSTIK